MFEYANGDKNWRLGNTLHRTDGPAVEYAHGRKEWWLHGIRHRTDGPAVEYADGRKGWHLHDELLFFDEWLAKTTGLTDEEKVMFKLKYG